MFITGRKVAARGLGANSARNIAHPNPSGAAISKAPPATHSVLTIIDRIPIAGGVFRGFQLDPLKKLLTPICDQTGQLSRNIKTSIARSSSEEIVAALIMMVLIILSFDPVPVSINGVDLFADGKINEQVLPARHLITDYY